jgi:hypothetical protein
MPGPGPAPPSPGGGRRNSQGSAAKLRAQCKKLAWPKARDSKQGPPRSEAVVPLPASAASEERGEGAEGDSGGCIKDQICPQ